jgi:hypothetical protein
MCWHDSSVLKMEEVGPVRGTRRSYKVASAVGTLSATSLLAGRAMPIG